MNVVIAYIHHQEQDIVAKTIGKRSIPSCGIFLVLRNSLLIIKKYIFYDNMNRSMDFIISSFRY